MREGARRARIQSRLNSAWDKPTTQDSIVSWQGDFSETFGSVRLRSDLNLAAVEREELPAASGGLVWDAERPGPALTELIPHEVRNPGAPNMNEAQGVEVPSKAGCSDRSEAQSVGPRGRREGSVERNRGSMDKKRIRGVEDRGERPSDRKAPATKGRRRRSDDRAVKGSVLTSGDLALRPNGRRGVAEREVSSGRSSRRGPLVAVCTSSKDQTRRRIKSP